MDELEQVLAVPSEYVSDLFGEPSFIAMPDAEPVLRRIKRHGSLVPRSWAEEHPEVKQIVAVCIVRNGSRLLCVRRSKKANRPHMRLKHTIVVGGHVDQDDMGVDDPARSCAVRELEEELGVSPSGGVTVVGCIADPATVSGNLHLAVVFDAEIAEEFVEVHPGLDNGEFVNSSRTNMWTLKTLSELRSLASKGAFDRWSSLLLQSRYASRLLMSDYPIATPQREIAFFSDSPNPAGSR